MTPSLWWISVACLTVGVALLITGIFKFRDPIKSRNWFFLSGLAFLLPVVFYLIITISETIPNNSLQYIESLFKPIFFEIVLIAVLCIGRFVVANFSRGRNVTLIGAGLLLSQLLIIILVLSLLSLIPLIFSAPWEKTIKYEEESGQITITGCKYYGSPDIVEIPSVIDGKSVTKIRQLSNPWISKIIIPDSVTIIAPNAFDGCVKLTDITIPDSVISIGEGAFSGCDSLTSITIPDSVTSLEGAFGSCDALKEIVTSPGNPNFSSVEGVLYSKDMKTIVAVPGGAVGYFTIPDGVTSIGTKAFTNCGHLLGVTIPDSVTNIGAAAFSHCFILQRIMIPDSVTSIDYGAFSSSNYVVLHCRKDSYAHNFAVEHDLRFELID